MIKPITPSEVQHVIPDFIIDAVNKLIKEKWDGKEAVIKQDEIMKIVSSDDPDDPRPTRKEIYDKCWLDFEQMYRKAGWDVDFEKPAYCETFDAYFTFKKKGRKKQ